jgi:D-amino peptidase
MKVFISSDFEGTAGVVDWDQVRPGGDSYRYYAELLTAEVNAAIEGATEGGARDFLVNDSHGKMSNLMPGSLKGRASYLSGRFKPRYMMQGLDASFDAVFFVSYHGSMSSARAVLSHTYFPAAFSEVKLNGHVTGEGGINSLVAKAFDIPVALVTGDAATAEEMLPFSPGIKAAVVKTSITRFAAESLHPDRANDLIRDRAREAIEDLHAVGPPSIGLPATLDVRFHTADYAELACRIAGIERTGDIAASITSPDPLFLYDTFITAVLLCRGLVE